MGYWMVGCFIVFFIIGVIISNATDGMFCCADFGGVFFDGVALGSIAALVVFLFNLLGWYISGDFPEAVFPNLFITVEDVTDCDKSTKPCDKVLHCSKCDVDYPMSCDFEFCSKCGEKLEAVSVEEKEKATGLVCSTCMLVYDVKAEFEHCPKCGATLFPVYSGGDEATGCKENLNEEDVGSSTSDKGSTTTGSSVTGGTSDVPAGDSITGGLDSRNGEGTSTGDSEDIPVV